MFKIRRAATKQMEGQPNPWGSETSVDSMKERYNFPNSTRTAIDFLFRAIHGVLPAELQQEFCFDDSPLSRPLQLYQIYDSNGIQGQNTGQHRERTLFFVLNENAGHYYIEMTLRQYAGSSQWRVMTVAYPRLYREHGENGEKGYRSFPYVVVVTPHVVNVGTEREKFAESGFDLRFED